MAALAQTPQTPSPQKPVPEQTEPAERNNATRHFTLLNPCPAEPGLIKPVVKPCRLTIENMEKLERAREPRLYLLDPAPVRFNPGQILLGPPGAAPLDRQLVCVAEDLDQPGLSDLLYRLCRQNIPTLERKPFTPGYGELIPIARDRR